MAVCAPKPYKPKISTEISLATIIPEIEYDTLLVNTKKTTEW